MAVFKSFPGLKCQKVKFKYFKHLIWTLLNDLRNGPALISWKDFQPRLYWTDNDLCNFLYYCNSIWLCCLLLFSNIAPVIFFNKTFDNKDSRNNDLICSVFSTPWSFHAQMNCHFSSPSCQSKLLSFTEHKRRYFAGCSSCSSTYSKSVKSTLFQIFWRQTKTQISFLL